VNLKKRDVSVISTGAIDVYRNNPNEALMKIIKFIQINSNTNIMILGIPHNHTSIIITSLNPTNITNSANKILQDINKWFTTNLLSLNADKTQHMQFITKTRLTCNV
jgi:hypothetical protein